jgi:hypothetical protein
MSIIQPALSYQNILEITDYVNKYRARHQAPHLSWDNTLVSFAQQWSYYMTVYNIFKHSGNSLYGENISFFEGYGTDPMTLLKLAIDGWYNEVSLYNFDNPGYSSATGHFTCLVWLSSTRFGMGISINQSTGQAYISFNTFPPGNIIGQFQQNVLPSTSYYPEPVPEPLPEQCPLPKPCPIPDPCPLPKPCPIPDPCPLPKPCPQITSNKQLVLGQLSNVISKLNHRYNQSLIIRDIYVIISEIRNSSDF